MPTTCELWLVNHVLARLQVNASNPQPWRFQLVGRCSPDLVVPPSCRSWARDSPMHHTHYPLTTTYLLAMPQHLQHAATKPSQNSDHIESSGCTHCNAMGKSSLKEVEPAPGTLACGSIHWEGLQSLENNSIPVQLGGWAALPWNSAEDSWLRWTLERWWRFLVNGNTSVSAPCHSKPVWSLPCPLACQTNSRQALVVLSHTFSSAHLLADAFPWWSCTCAFWLHTLTGTENPFAFFPHHHGPGLPS